MRQSRRRVWLRFRPSATILIAAVAPLVALVPVIIGGADSAAAAPSPGYTASLIPIGEAAFSVAVDPDTNTAYIGDESADELSVLDGSTNTVTDTIALAAEPYGIAVDPATDTVYVSVVGSDTTSAALDVIDGATDTVTDTIALPTGSHPFGVAVDSVTGVVYVAEWDASAVAVINASTNTVTATISTGSGTSPRTVAVDETSDVVWVGDTSGNVFAISGASDTVTQTISFGSALVEGVDVDPDTDTVYAALYRTDDVAVIDGSTGAIETTISVTEQPISVSVDPASGTVFVESNEGSGSPGTTWVIDESSDAIVDTIARGGLQVAANTATGAAYEAAGTAAEDVAWVLTPSAANAMSPVITSNSVGFTVGIATSFTITASALPAATYSEVGALPSGVTLSPSGIISGTPAAGTVGSYPIQVTASNGVLPDDTATFTLIVAAQPAFTSAEGVTFTVGVAGSFTVTTNGSPAPTFSESGVLPAGVTFSSAGVLSGTPAAGSDGSYPITITASNSYGTATQAFTLGVDQAPAITSADQATFAENVAGSFTFTTTGYPAPVFSESGALPAGVTLGTTGVLSGTPATGTSGSYSIQVTASDVAGSVTQQFTLTVIVQPYEVQASQQSGWCLDNTGGSSNNGNPIQIWSCQGNANQGWTYVPSVNGVTGDYQLENSNGLCLDDPNDSSVNGSKMQLWSCLGDASQIWTQVTVGSYTEYQNANGLCLDNTGNSLTDGNRVQVWACNGDVAQQWYGPNAQSSTILLHEVQASQDSQFCLDNTGGLASDGNPIEIWACLNNANQAWKYVPSVNGVAGDYQLENSNGLCLDDPNDSSVNGTKVQLWSCLGDASQIWTQVAVGSYTEYVNANGLCLDNTGDALTDGNRVQVWACTGDLAQQWYGPSALSGP